MSDSDSSSSPRRKPPRRRGSSETNPSSMAGLKAVPVRPVFCSKGDIQLLRPPFFNIFSFVDFLGRNKVSIFKQEEIEIFGSTAPYNEEDNTPNIFLNEGISMKVRRAQLNGKDVVIKQSRILSGTLQAGSQEDLAIYHAFMTDIQFEVMVMTHKPLCLHQNITRLIGLSFEDSSDDNNYNNDGEDLVLPILVAEPALEEYVDLKAFFSYTHTLRPITIDVAESFIKDIATGLNELHAYGIVHADLKPSNILLFKYSESGGRLTAKLSDFGFSGLEPFSIHPRGGTSIWNAPESISSCPLRELKPFAQSFTRDIYAFGLVALTIALDGAFPLSSKDPKLKYDDEAVNDSIRKLQQAYTHDQSFMKLSTFMQIAEDTLQLWPTKRVQDLNGVIKLLETKIVAGIELEAQRLPLPDLTLSSDIADDAKFHDQSSWVHLVYPSFPLRLKRYLAKRYKSEIIDTSETLTNENMSSLGNLLAGDGLLDIDMITKLQDLWLERDMVCYPEHGKNTSKINNDQEFLLQGLKLDLRAQSQLLGENSENLLKVLRGNASPDVFEDNSIFHRSTKDGWNFAHLAAIWNSASLLVFLHELGIPTDQAGGPKKFTPLHEAARGGNVEATQQLLKFRVDVDGRANKVLGSDYSPLTLVGLFGGNSDEAFQIAEMLLSSGARQNLNVHKPSLIHSCLKSPKILELILYKRPDLIEIQNTTRQTPLSESVTLFNVSAAEILIEHGANVNVRDETNATPLHSLFALIQGLIDLDFVQEFFRNIDSFDFSFDKLKAMVHLLIDNGADVDAESNRPGYADFPEQSLTPEAAMWNDGIYSSEEDVPLSYCKLEPLENWLMENDPLDEEATWAILVPTIGRFAISTILPQVYPHNYELFLTIGRLGEIDNNLSFNIEIRMLRPNLAQNVERTIYTSDIAIAKLLQQAELPYMVHIADFHIGHLAPVLVVLKNNAQYNDEKLNQGMFFGSFLIRRKGRPHNVKIGEIEGGTTPSFVGLATLPPKEGFPSNGTLAQIGTEGLERPYPEDMDLLGLLFPGDKGDQSE